MLKIIRQGGWFTSLIIFSMPLFLILFLGSVMARFQVKSEFDTYQKIQEYTSLAALADVPDQKIVMLHGRIAEGTSPDWAGGLIVFQERPLEGREVRFQEEFPLIFPEFTLELADSTLLIQPSVQRGQVIAHEIHRVIDDAADREYTGFRAGDTVTVQGEWLPATSGEPAVLSEVTGITGTDRAGILADWQVAFRRLDSIMIILGFLTLLSLVLLIIQVRRLKSQVTIEQRSELLYG